jgi:hypothetical protein
MPGLRHFRRPAARADQAGAASDRLAGRRVEPNRPLRGHTFLPAADELAQIPGIAAVRRVQPARRVVWLHYFTGYCDWYVCGLNSDGEAFGYVLEPAAGISQWSYCDLPTMCLLVLPADPLLIVRRDLHWRPRLAGQILHPAGPHRSIRPTSA